jgi:hypothetical protein
MSSPDLQALGQQAIGLHREGRSSEAQRLYRQILQINPRIFPALYLLGVLRLEQGDAWRRMRS